MLGKINYEEAEKAAEFPVFAKGLYRCEILEVQENLKNEYQGKPSPNWTMKIRPLNLVMDEDGPMLDTNGAEMKSETTKEDGTTAYKYVFFNLGIPLKISPDTNFGKLISAIFPDGKPTYEYMVDYIENTVICNLAVKEKTAGGLKNVIEAISTDPKNVVEKKEATKEERAAEEVFEEEPKKKDQELG